VISTSERGGAGGYRIAVTAEKQGTATPAAGTRERLPSLTGLRFVAAFLVFGFHLHVAHLLDTGAAGTAMEWVFGQGAVGVSFFFILSGFVLTWSARAVDTPRRFWQRRFAKVYPNHAATWLAALGVALVSGAGVTAAVALPNLLLVQAWVPDPAVYYGMNSPSWSLACEALFYALFVPLYAGFARLPARALWPATAVALGLVWLVPLAAQALPAGDRYWAIYVFPPARLPEFAAGMLLALVVRAGLWPRLGIGAAGALAVATYLVSRLLPEDIHYVAVTAVPLALLIAAVGVADAEGLPSPWRARWMIWLGETSFAFYLVHQLALRMVVRVTGADRGVAAEAVIALACLGLAVLGSWLLYRVVELPGMRLLRPRPVRPPVR
jgi:peptidoglycan/LPS O-acetylase OafA/YrhL